MLTSCSFQLLFGRIYTFYSPKWVFISAIVVFEVGSTLCGAAPSSVVFIVGRAIAGLGSSAIFSGAIVIVMNLVPLHRRPIFTGFLGATFGIASVIGPLLGGALTQRSTWRWCFYLNLPVGGVAILTLVPTLKLPAAMKANTPLRRQIDQLDPLGTLCFLPGVVCLLLALQWGGTTYAWKDGRIIALLVLFGVLMIAFITIQIWRQEMATVPPRIVRNRSIAAGIWFSLCIGGSSMLMVYYLPVWFQAVRGVGAIESGIMVLPLILALTVGSILAGGLVTRFGYYVPFLLASSVIMSIALGLITTFQRDTGHATWIGYQVLYGFGIGLGMQQSGLAAQAVLAEQDVPVGASLMFFSQSLGGAVFVSIGQVVFANRLVSGLEHVSGFDPVRVVNTGATDLRNAFGPASLDIIPLGLQQSPGQRVRSCTGSGLPVDHWSTCDGMEECQGAAGCRSGPSSDGSSDGQSVRRGRASPADLTGHHWLVLGGDGKGRGSLNRRFRVDEDSHG